MLMLHFYRYLNYAWEDQDPITSYGWESVQELQLAKKEHDPNGIFAHLVKGGFKIPKSKGREL